jgi:uncharacterized membrane protein HdeD (DUF308 family)
VRNNYFLLGALTACSTIAALFFIRFWRATRDGLFLAFAIFFLTDAVTRATLALTFERPNEGSPLIYIARLAASLAIVAAIWMKNTRPR